MSRSQLCFLTPTCNRRSFVLPPSPSSALSAFMFFSTENRPKVLEDNPDIKFGEIGKELGARWKSLTPAQKGVSPPAFALSCHSFE